MSQTAKCPVCECPMVEYYLGWKCPTDICGFRCSKNSLPRIAAAMDYVRATKAWADRTGSDTAFAKFKAAQIKAMEVFNDE